VSSWNSSVTQIVSPAKRTVRMFGMDKNARPFSENVDILEIRSGGARVAGLKAPIALGETVGVQLGEQKARFRVKWTGVAGSADAGQAELEVVQMPENFWGFERRPLTRVTPLQVGASDRRKHTRFLINGTANIRKLGSTDSFEVLITDISQGGCYLQTFAPLPTGTSIVVQGRVDEQTFGVSGIIRTCHPNMGMGVEFTGGARTGLLAVLEKLSIPAPEAPAGPDAPAPAKADSLYTTNLVQSVSKDLQSLAQLLQCTDVEPNTLRRFRDLLGEVRNTAWAMQQYLESQGGNETGSAQLDFLNSERIRLATQLCRSLINDAGAASANPMELHELASSVTELIAASVKAHGGE
jgi:hypothetical protein